MPVSKVAVDLNLKRIPALLLALIIVFSLCACAAQQPESVLTPVNIPVIQPEAPTETAVAGPEEAPEEESKYLPAEDGYYYDLQNVILYLDAYGHLPGNYITKNEARKLGWDGGSVERFIDDMAIGGDRFSNREGLLPKGKYRECDIGTLDKRGRGAKRLIYSDDGLLYYTDDHYETFTEYRINNGEAVPVSH